MTYQGAGVNIDAADALVKKIGPAVASTHRKEVLAGVGGFASIVSLPSGYSDPVLVSGTDGVGTKLKIAFETGNHQTIGIDLVAMCANDVLAVGAEPLFFLDYYACTALDASQAADVISGIAEGCRRAGCALVGGETAELPGFYSPGEYDLAGFLVGVAERDRIITGERVQPGDAVIGLLSSGLHSNGYSLVRALVDRHGVRLDHPLDGTNTPLGDILLEPTRIYASAMKRLIAAVDVRAIAHITGGGLVENIPRTLPDGLGVRLEAGWPVPRIFRWIAEIGPVDSGEMLRTFNLGIGMTAIIPATATAAAIKLLNASHTPAHLIGQVVRVDDDKDRVEVEGVI